MFQTYVHYLKKTPNASPSMIRCRGGIRDTGQSSAIPQHLQLRLHVAVHHRVLEQIRWQQSLRDVEVMIALGRELRAQRELGLHAQRLELAVAEEVRGGLAGRGEAVAGDLLLRHP